MAAAKHPLVAADRPHAPADLIGEILKTELIKCLGQRAGLRVVGHATGGGLEKIINRLRKPPVEQMNVGARRGPSGGPVGNARWKKEPADRIKEIEGLNRADRASFRRRRFYQVLSAGPFPVPADVKVVADHQQKQIVAEEFAPAANRIAVAVRFGLFDKGNSPRMWDGGAAAEVLVARAGDDAAFSMPAETASSTRWVRTERG